MSSKGRIFTSILILTLVVGVYEFQHRQSGPTVPVAALCPAIQDVVNRPLAEMNFNGTWKSESANGFHDDYLYDQEGKIKVGVRENWGGAMIFFGRESENTLDDSDLSRGLQTVFREDVQKKTCDTYGWNPVQGGNRCHQGSGVDAIVHDATGLSLITTPLHFSSTWERKSCPSEEVSCSEPAQKAHLRISQSLRFVRAGVLEVEYLVTNLEDRTIEAKRLVRHEFPRLFANPALLKSLRNVQPGEDEGRRDPAASGAARNYTAHGGWAAIQNQNDDYGLGIYWENRNEQLTSSTNSSFSSHFGFELPEADSVRGRFYLLIGGLQTVKALAEDLDRKLPPFGRIDENEIQEDTRSVRITGWALDNKGITQLELWIDGKKTMPLKLNSQREDVCVTYPGYSMCGETHAKVGFEAIYSRPDGKGCDKVVEIKATDSDGNSRVIARTGVSPVSY